MASKITSPYLKSKAEMYIKLGHEKYSKMDALKMPPIEWEQEFGVEIWDTLLSGCKQIIENKGMTADNPFENIGIVCMNMLMEIFHYEFVEQKLINESEKDGTTYMLDNIKYKHIKKDEEISVFNLVEYID